MNMKLCVCGFVLTIIALGTVVAKADTLEPKAFASDLSGGAIGALMVARDVPEPRTVLLLAAGLISLALFTTIGRPPFRLKF